MIKSPCVLYHVTGDLEGQNWGWQCSKLDGSLCIDIGDDASHILCLHACLQHASSIFQLCLCGLMWQLQ